MNSKRIATIIFLVFSSLVYTLAAQAETQAFKCTAEDGKISYLDTRPSTGCVTIEVVRVNVGKGTPGTAVEDQENGTAANGTGKEGSDAKVDKAIAEKKAAIKKDCDAQKKNLETLKTKTFVQTKGEDGKLRTLTPEELVERKGQVEEYVKTMCSE